MVGQRDVDLRASGNHKEIVPGKSTTDFKASEKMTDPQDMLAVVYDLHNGILFISFPGSAWECVPGGSASHSPFPALMLW